MSKIIFALESKAALTHAAKLSTLRGVMGTLNWTVLDIRIDASDTVEQSRLRINLIDPQAQAYLWAFGKMKKPWCGPIAPDGHTNLTSPWPSLSPWQIVVLPQYAAMGYDWASMWQPNGDAAKGWGAYYQTTTNPPGTWRPGVGATDASGYAGIDEDEMLDHQLDMIIAHMQGLLSWPEQSYIVDHLNYPGSPVLGLGDSMAAQLTAAGRTYKRSDLIDWDPADLPGDPMAGQYFAELFGQRYLALLYASGGRGVNAEYYVATTAGVEAAKPTAICVFSEASRTGLVWADEDLVRAFDFYALGSLYIDRSFPDISLWLQGQETTGDMARRHAQAANATYMPLMGFPAIKVDPSTLITATGGGMATGLTAADMTTIGQMINQAVMDAKTSIKADYTAAISAALQTTSAPQAAPPTGTSTGTGTSGSGTASGGAASPSAVPIVNCGINDGAFSATGLTWTNVPAASIPVDLSGISAPYDQSVYHSGRGGQQASLKLTGYPAGSTQNLRLDFNEPHWTQSGKRVFDVTVNGIKVLAAFDIFAAAGAMNKAVSKVVPAQVGADGTIAIVLTAVASSPDQNAYLCALGNA